VLIFDEDGTDVVDAVTVDGREGASTTIDIGSVESCIEWFNLGGGTICPVSWSGIGGRGGRLELKCGDGVCGL
jgi:hypothetical protein